MLLALMSCSITPHIDGHLGTSVADRIEDGTTMFGVAYPAESQQILEIDVDGDTVWSYTLPPEVYLPEGALGPSLLMDVEPLDNGNVLFTVFPAGVFEINRDGQVVWMYLDDKASHDSDRLPNGNTLISRTWAEKGDKQIIEVDPSGNEVWAWTGLGKLGEDERFKDLADEGDAWMHITSLDRTPEGATRICIRNFNLVATIQPDGKLTQDFLLQAMPDSQVAQTTGKVVGERPHGAEWIEDDHFLIATRRPNAIFEMKSGKVAWKFQHPDLTGVRDVDRLDNGNVLVTAKDRIAEVDPAGEILWQWVLPDPPEHMGWDELHPLMSVSRLAADGSITDRD